MNENYRNTLWRAALIVAAVFGATTLVGWLMRARYDASVSPIEVIRPSAWTGLGVGAMLIPLGLAAYVGLVHWFNRTAPEGGSNDPAVRARVRLRTALLSLAGLVLAAGVALVANGAPFESDHNRSIFWRGFISGWVLFAALVAVELLILELARRAPNQQDLDDLDYAVRHHRDLMDDNGIDWRATF
jgi:hypothetical protein